MSEEINEEVDYLNISENDVKSSIVNLPNRPSAQGMSADAIKAALFEPAIKVLKKLNAALESDEKTENSVKWLIAAAVAGLIGGEQDEDTSTYDTLKKLYKALVNLKTLVGESLPKDITEKTVIAYIESVEGDLANVYTKTEVDTEVAKKSAIKVNGEVQTEWDATGVNITNDYAYDRVAILKANNGGLGSYAALQANFPQAYTFAVRNNAGAIHGNTSDSDADTVLVNKQYLSKKLTELIGEEGAIEALDTLRELGAAINNDADFAGTMIAKHNEMEARLDKVDKFTTDDVNKFVVVGADGELTAVEIATGGSY